MWLKIGGFFSLTLAFIGLGLVDGMTVDLYINRDKFGEYFKLDISEKGCTNVPLNWENQASSLDTHGSCIKFYDLPYCRGKFVALQPYHGTFQDNLATLRFDKIISSASPCGPKVPAGRYYIQNGADGSVLTIETRNGSAVARTKAFKPYIAKGQQFQVEKVAIADYEIIPRVHEKMNPITYDMSVSTGLQPVKRSWKIESVYKGKYIIKNEWNNKCLYKSDSNKVEEHECVIWSPNQEWMFRSIKVRPFFPSKDELKKKPIGPYDDFPFDPQQLNQYHQSGQRLPNRFRPKHPAVALGYNLKEPFPPVLPQPILPRPGLPRPTVGKNQKKQKVPPVPHVRHPGGLPFPPEPIVTVPRKPVARPPLKPAVKVTKKNKKKNNEEQEDEAEDKSEEKDLDDKKSAEEELDDKKSEENDSEEKKSEESDADDKKSEEKDLEDKKSEEKEDDKTSDEKEADDIKSEERDSGEKPSVEKNDEDDDDKRGRKREDITKHIEPEEEEEEEKPKYSDFRLYF